jgi:hypothetical protein
MARWDAIFRALVIDLLRSPPAQQINFYFGTFHIWGQHYLKIANLVMKGSIGVKYEAQAAGAAASYWTRHLSHGSPYYSVPSATYGMQPVDKLCLIHESTHAIADWIYGPFVESDTLDEAAAYIAGALYGEYAGIATGGPPQFGQATQIAQSIMNQPGAMISAQDTANIRTTIAARQVYSSMGVTYNSTVYRK